MDINTKYFGKLTFSTEQILCFKRGPFGFEDKKNYALIPFEEDNDSLLCLQSTEEQSLAFVVINPFAFIADYAPGLTKEDYADLEADQKSPLLFYNICVLRDNIEQSTVNLRCPVVININTKKAKQIILDDTDYSFKLPFGQLTKKEGLC